MKKRKPEAIFIPNQIDKNPCKTWWWMQNDKDIEQRYQHEERRKKHALKKK